MRGGPASGSRGRCTARADRGPPRATSPRALVPGEGRLPRLRLPHGHLDGTSGERVAVVQVTAEVERGLEPVDDPDKPPGDPELRADRPVDLLMVEDPFDVEAIDLTHLVGAHLALGIQAREPHPRALVDRVEGGSRGAPGRFRPSRVRLAGWGRLLVLRHDLAPPLRNGSMTDGGTRGHRGRRSRRRGFDGHSRVGLPAV